MYFPLLKPMVKCTYRWAEIGVLLKFISIVAPVSLECIVLVISEESFDRSLVLLCIQKNGPLPCLKKDAGRESAETRPLGTARARIPVSERHVLCPKTSMFCKCCRAGQKVVAHILGINQVPCA